MAIKDLILRIKGDSSSLQKETKKAEGTLSKFSNGLAKLAPLIAGAFSVQQVIAFTKRAIELASKVEGIGRAFKKLNNPALLDDLQKATRGTVDNIQLMQYAVRANNFKIPLDQLATFFEFATNRAIETGESVDYLVESIITGIGRKSVLVMDNLGISAVELQQEVGKVGDFGKAAGNTIAREMAKGGQVLDTAAINAARLRAEFTNITTEVGTKLLPVWNKFLEKVNSFVMDVANIKTVSAESFVASAKNAAGSADTWEKSNEILIDHAKQLKNNITIWGKSKQYFEDQISGVKRFLVSSRKYQEASTLVEDYSDKINAARDAVEQLELMVRENARTGDVNNKMNQARIDTIQSLTTEIENLTEAQKTQTGDELTGTNKQIKIKSDLIEMLKKQGLELENIRRKTEEIQKIKIKGLPTLTAGIITERPKEPVQVTGGITPVAALAPSMIDSSRIPQQTIEISDAFTVMGQQIYDSWKLAGEGAWDFAEQMDITAQQIGDAILDLSSGFIGMFEGMANAVDNYLEVSSKITGSAEEMAQAQDDAAKQLKNAIRSSIKGFIAEGVAAIIANTLKGPEGLLGPLALPIAGLAGAGAAALFSALIPSFAGGGIVDRPTLAMVGDNPGRKEAIIPSELWGKIGGGGRNGYIAETRISGRDLQILIKRQNDYLGRV